MGETLAKPIASADAVQRRRRILQNYLLIWVDADFDPTDTDDQCALEQLRAVVHDVTVFAEPDGCIDFLRDISKETVFVIIADPLSATLVPQIHGITHLDSIYLVCHDPSSYEQWTTAWPKVKGTFTHIEPICDALQLATKQCNQDSTPMSFVELAEETSSTHSSKLESSFMYTQLFKGILLDKKLSQETTDDLITFCRGVKSDVPSELKLIDKFQRDYRPTRAIWWYTRECFIYEMLNRSLRLLEGDTIVEMGFFICDLHRQIEQLHQKQLPKLRGQPFVVYRGQGLSTVDFQKLRKSQGGLMSFNSFLSTSKKRHVSLDYAHSASSKTSTVGVLFVMTVDPAVISTPFASIDKVSYFGSEGEVLFSMHAVFRIGHVQTIGTHDRLFEVHLTATSDDDEELRKLTHQINYEIIGFTKEERLGQLLIKIGQLDKAEELFVKMLDSTEYVGAAARLYDQLGCIQFQRGDYEQALSFYEKAHEIRRRTLKANHQHMAQSFDHIARVYDAMGKHSVALTYLTKALDIRVAWRGIPRFNLEIAQTQHNIGLIHSKMGEYAAAVPFLQQAHETFIAGLPDNHPHVASSCSSISAVYHSMGQYSEARSFAERALNIRQNTLPANHPDLASAYNNLGLVYDKTGEYDKALPLYEKALDIYRVALSDEHPHVIRCCTSIGSIHEKNGEYAKALPFLEKALAIRQKTLPDDHGDLISSYNSIALVYHSLGGYLTALSFYEKARVIQEKTLRTKNPDLAVTYNNLGLVCDRMGFYSNAAMFYEMALDIRQDVLPGNHPDLLSSYNSIAGAYDKRREYAKSLSFLEKALDYVIDTSHPDLAVSYHNIGSVYYRMGEYAKALSFFEKALDIRQKTLPADHSDLASSYRHIADTHDRLVGLSCVCCESKRL